MSQIGYVIELMKHSCQISREFQSEPQGGESDERVMSLSVLFLVYDD
jgi:hypothetical protein